MYIGLSKPFYISKHGDILQKLNNNPYRKKTYIESTMDMFYEDFFNLTEAELLQRARAINRELKLKKGSKWSETQLETQLGFVTQNLKQFNLVN